MLTNYVYMHLKGFLKKSKLGIYENIIIFPHKWNAVKPDDHLRQWPSLQHLFVSHVNVK